MLLVTLKPLAAVPQCAKDRSSCGPCPTEHDKPQTERTHYNIHTMMTIVSYLAHSFGSSERNRTKFKLKESDCHSLPVLCTY